MKDATTGSWTMPFGGKWWHVQHQEGILGLQGTRMFHPTVANQPVSVAIDASESDFQFYSSAVFTGECGTGVGYGASSCWLRIGARVDTLECKGASVLQRHCHESFLPICLNHQLNCCTHFSGNYKINICLFMYLMCYLVNVDM